MSLSKFFLIFFMGISFKSVALFESKAGQNCTAALEACGNYLLSEGLNVFGNCTDTYETCLKKILQYPITCFSADASWTNFYISSALFVVVFGLTNAAIPAATKGIAWGITKCMNLDPTKYFFLRKFGDFCGVFANTDDDRKVTAAELLSPQTIITILSAGFPIALLTTAISQQALCDHDLTYPPL